MSTSAYVLLGDNRVVLKSFKENTIDSIVTDPPYELGFMGKSWDATGIAYDVELWKECLRVLKPGGHLLAFGAPRNYHRLAVAIEDAGFEIRDSIHWIYGSGFPKSLNVSKAIDKISTHLDREVVGRVKTNIGMQGGNFSNGGKVGSVDVTAPASDEAKQWEGWGTGLRPAHEPIVVARKPFSSTVAVNVLTYGTGAINTGACRVGTSGGHKMVQGDPAYRQVPGGDKSGAGFNGHGEPVPGLGRTPTNLVFSHLPECVETGESTETYVIPERQALPMKTAYNPGTFGAREEREVTQVVQTFSCVPGCPVAELDSEGSTTSRVGIQTAKARSGGILGAVSDLPRADYGQEVGYSDQGGKSRYFPTFKYQGKATSKEKPRDENGKTHATIKPLPLMRWLVRLVTPPNGIVLDPFAGSGSTLQAAQQEGFVSIGIEQEPEYVELIKIRMPDIVVR